MEKEILCRIASIERKYKRLKIACVSIITLLMIAFVSFSFNQSGSFDIIRAKGIVIQMSLEETGY